MPRAEADDAAAPTTVGGGPAHDAAGMERLPEGIAVHFDGSDVQLFRLTTRALVDRRRFGLRGGPVLVRPGDATMPAPPKRPKVHRIRMAVGPEVPVRAGMRRRLKVPKWNSRTRAPPGPL